MYRHPNYLCHYGVKGMKWGIRKSKYYSKSRAKRRKSYSSDYKKTERLRKKNYKQLSDDELKDLNKRLQLEKQYRDLNPKGIYKGQQYVKSVIGIASTIGGLYALKNSPMAKDLISKVGKGSRKSK